MGGRMWGKGAFRASVAVIVWVGMTSGQTLTNQALNGKFFFRHVSLAMDAAGNITDPRSLIGTITFDGAGHYSFTGQQVAGDNPATALSGNGNYSVDPAGFVSLDNPQRTGVSVSARVGPEALLGSSTESGGNTFDLFGAVPAPSSGSTAALTGTYWVATLEFPGGSAANSRSAIFNLTAGSGGSLSTVTVNGHAADVSAGVPRTQQIAGAGYTMNADGTGSVNFGSSSTLLGGSKTLYVSADGNLVIGGSSGAGAHDFLIGVKAVTSASAASWSGNFWAAGLRTDAAEAPPDLAYSGAVHSNGGQRLTWTKRLQALGQGASDITEAGSYTLNADGSGTMPLSVIGLGAGGKAFVAIALDAGDQNAYEIDFGVRMADLSGGGVFLNPQGIYNAASFAPAGNPISPGEFLTLFGTGLANTTKTATPPYPSGGFNNVTVLINNIPAPIYYISPNQINCLVPYAVHGPTATIVVENGPASNSVTVPVAATSPGIFALDQSGLGAGAILHADYSIVNSSKPAVAGETVLVFLTGMGAVTPAVADGTAGGASPLSNSVNPVTVYVGGELCAVQPYNGLAPGFPGLYQINVTLPPYLPASGALPLALSTGNAFHDQVTIAVH